MPPMDPSLSLAPKTATAVGVKSCSISDTRMESPSRAIKRIKLNRTFERLGAVCDVLDRIGPGRLDDCRSWRGLKMKK
jgi:hypothetical protein